MTTFEFLVGNDGSLYAPSLDSSFYVDVVDMDGTSTSNSGLHSHQGNNNNLSNGSHQHHHHHHHARQKRVRTSFKHHQLRCMRSYFNLNHNPGMISNLISNLSIFLILK